MPGKSDYDYHAAPGLSHSHYGIEWVAGRDRARPSMMDSEGFPRNGGPRSVVAARIGAIKVPEGTGPTLFPERCENARQRKVDVALLSTRMRGSDKPWIFARTPMQTGGSEGLVRAVPALQQPIMEGRLDL